MVAGSIPASPLLIEGFARRAVKSAGNSEGDKMRLFADQVPSPKNLKVVRAEFNPSKPIPG